MKRILFLALGLAGARSAAAQDPWRSSYFPYLIGNPADGVMVVARWQRTQNAPYFVTRADSTEVVNPITFAGAVSVDAGIGTLGSRFVRAELRAPGQVDGWRFRALLAGERQGRFGWYGFGGDIERVENVADPNANIYRVHRARYLAQLEVTRRVSGGLRVSLGGFLERADFTALPESTLFRTDVGAKLGRTTLLLRPGLVFDTRDREFTPSKGVLLEAGIGIGTGAVKTATDDQSLYALGYAQLKGYVSLREGTVIAGRALHRSVENAAPASARFVVPGWERELTLSGSDGHRGLPAGALAASRFSLLSLDVRHDLLNAGDLGAVTVIGFVDYAHAADDAASVRRKTDQFGGGGGLAVRILRSAILTMSFAGGSNGFNFSMGTSWAF